MPKMKHLLRKFHIGSGVADQNPPPPAPVLDPHVDTNRFEESESPSSESPRTTPSLTAALPATDESNSADFNFFEEEFQVQLALAISASDPDSCDDPESAQIKAAQQISLACSPSGNLVQFLSLRYWNYNVVNYNEKVMDGFYDVYGINPSVVVQGKMPLLADLKGISVLDTVDYEVILVNRATDMELRQLEESVYFLSRECWTLKKVPTMSFLVQKIADIVVNRMGGPVSDAEEISKRWTAKSYELRMSLNTIVLPLGCLDIGHSRHRALLFKVLADRINLPCNLVKGSYYTGTDVGAVNLIKFDNGSEYMIDLMGAPGALIPTEAPSGQLQSYALNIHGVTPVPFGGNIISSFPVHHTATGTESGSLTARLEGLSVSHDNTFTTQRMHIREASECDTSPAKNLESKLQGNLPENRMSLHSDLFLGAIENQLSENGVMDTRQTSTNNEQSLIAFTGGQFPGNISFKGYGKHSNEVWEIEQQEEPHIVAARGHNASYDTSDKNCTNKDNESAIKAMELVTCIQSKSYTGQKEQLDPMLHEVASWEIPWEDLHVGERIGIGSFGEVYHAEWNGTEVAVKKFMNQDITSDALAQFKCEVEIMLRLRHPNVVLFMGAVTRPPNLSILTEFLPRGGLYRLLHRPNIQIDEKKRMRMALDVAKGMNYLHTSNPIIVHRDLKTPNLLVDKNWVVKVCDFGMSRLKHHTFLSSKSTAGTAEWMAPEVLRNEPSNEKSDVYSFGVILWELATLEVPWSGMNSMQVVGAVGFQGRRLDIPATVDHAVAEIIRDCWNQNSQVRPPFGQIITRLKCLQRLNIPGSETCTNQQ